MHDFAIVALLGLAVLKVADLLEEVIPALSRTSALLRLALGVAVAVTLDYSMFAAYGISVRDSWMGTWGTGLMIGSLGTVWTGVFGFLGTGEAEGAEHHRISRPRAA